VGRVVEMRATGGRTAAADQIITVDDVMFTGDLVETGQFAIMPWFPPYDTDVSGLRWIAVMRRLMAEAPAIVVPRPRRRRRPAPAGRRARHYLELLRDETWVRRDSAMPPRRSSRRSPR